MRQDSARRRNSCIWVAILSAIGGAGPAIADEIVASGEKLERLRIIDMNGGNIAFRTPATEFRMIPIADVERLTIDTLGTLNDLNEAEEFYYRGDFVRSLTYYERAIRVATDHWRRLVRARLIQACDRADRIDGVAEQIVALLQDEATGPALVATLLPATSPSKGARSVPRALRTIDEVIEKAASQSARVLLDSLRFHIIHRSGGKDSLESARHLVEQPIPPAIATRGVYAVRAAAMMVIANGGDPARAVNAANVDIGVAPAIVLPELLMVKARVLFESARDDADRLSGASTAMRVVIHYPGDRLAPEALLHAARVYERIGRPPTALRLLDECVAHVCITAALKEEASKMADRLRNAG